VPFDYAYTRSVLSADAVPSFVDVLADAKTMPTAPGEDPARTLVSRCGHAWSLIGEYLEQPAPATTWSVGRCLARRAVVARADALRAACPWRPRGST
jgi:hypothetical protein